MEKTGKPRKPHPLAASKWSTLWHGVILSTAELAANSLPVLCTVV